MNTNQARYDQARAKVIAYIRRREGDVARLDAEIAALERQVRRLRLPRLLRWIAA